MIATTLQPPFSGGQQYAIHLYVDTGGVRLFDRFLVYDNLSVPCILGTEFI